MSVGLNTILRHLKNSEGHQSVTSRIQPGGDVIVCAKWTNSGAMSGLNRASAGCLRVWRAPEDGCCARIRWTHYGDAGASYEPAVTLWRGDMDDGWLAAVWIPPEGKLHVISKRYTQRIEQHNLNLRQHTARLGRKSLSFSKSVELHDKVIGHYLNIKHYQ